MAAVTLLVFCLGAAPETMPATRPTQVSIPWVESMPRVPTPLHVIDWKQTAADYYRVVFDSSTTGENLPAVNLTPDASGFSFPGYLGPNRKWSTTNGESINCVAAVAGAQLVGLDMRHLHGVDWVRDTQRWFDPDAGIFRLHIGQRAGVISHVIYGYWPLALGLIAGDLNRDDPAYRRDLDQQFAFLLGMAHDMGCPDHPDLKQGYDVATRACVPVRVDWSPANASCLAWMLYAGYQWTGNRDYLDCAVAALKWERQHPGRYEIAHAMGPLTVARIDAEQAGRLDLGWSLDNWFGDSRRAGGRDQQWGITHGERLDGMTLDGLDGARARGKDETYFYAFAMGSYQGPAWLLPVARYAPRYARSIARYALNTANSCRLFLGIDLDADHQDHLDWRRGLPDGKGFLFSYEGMRSEPHWTDPGHRFTPYATGDPLALFSKRYDRSNSAQYWADKKQFSRQSQNISLYMGNHIGFLGAVYNATDVPGIIAWDLVKTDYFHRPCYPTYLLYNPFDQARTVHVDAGPTPHDLYDAVSGRFLCRNVSGRAAIALAPDDVVVLVLSPANGTLTRVGGKTLVNNVVINYPQP